MIPMTLTTMCMGWFLACYAQAMLSIAFAAFADTLYIQIAVSKAKYLFLCTWPQLSSWMRR
jgi:hypothetical protein